MAHILTKEQALYTKILRAEYYNTKYTNCYILFLKTLIIKIIYGRKVIKIIKNKLSVPNILFFFHTFIERTLFF